MGRPIIPTLILFLSLPKDILKRYSDDYIDEHYDELPKEAILYIGYGTGNDDSIREADFSRDLFIFKVKQIFQKYDGFSTPYKDKVRKFCQQYGIPCPKLYTPEEAAKCIDDYMEQKEKEGKTFKCRHFSYVGDSILDYFNMKEVFKLLKQKHPEDKYSYGFAELLPSGEYAVTLLCYETGCYVVYTLSELHELYGDEIDETGTPLIDYYHFYDKNGEFKLSDAYQQAHPTKNRSSDDDLLL